MYISPMTRRLANLTIIAQHRHIFFATDDFCTHAFQMFRGGRNWIDSSSLMYRLKIPSTLLNSGLIDFTGKTDPEDEAYIATMRNQQQAVSTKVQAQPDWDKLLQAIPKDASKTDIAGFLLEPKLSSTLINTIDQSADIKTMIIDLVSTPEYQLC